MITSKKGKLAKYYIGGMTPQRYNELMTNLDSVLTEQESINGWFFSNEFDGLLVHESWPEAGF